MNEDELELRLRDELHRRIRPPHEAPVELWSRIDRSTRLEPVVPQRPVSLRAYHPTRRARFGAFGGLVAAAAVVALVAAGLMVRRPTLPVAPGSLPSSVEMFGRVDARTAWASAGGDLYITRDGGATWTKGSIPGSGLAATYEAIAKSTPCPETSGCSNQTIPFPDRLYPTFLDADHGWLVSWTLSNPSNYTASTFTLSVSRTADGGRTWTKAAVPGIFRGFGVAQFVDPSHGVLSVYDLTAVTGGSTESGGHYVGNDPAVPSAGPTEPAASTTEGTTVLTTSDGGATWTKRTGLPGIAAVSLAGPSELWAITTEASTESPQDTHVRHSTDGAATWTDATLPAVPGCSGYSSLQPQPAKSGGALHLAFVCSVISFSADGPQVSEPTDSYSAFSTPRNEIVDFESRDDGASWTSVTTRSVDGSQLSNGGFGYWLQVVKQQPVSFLAPVDTPGVPRILASFDAGATWERYLVDGLPNVPAFAEWAAPGDLWVGVQHDSATSGMPMMTVYATKDGGKTWRGLLGSPQWPASPEPSVTPQMATPVPAPTAIVDPSQPMITSVGLVDAMHGWAVRGSSVLTTDDGGQSWRDVAIPGAPGQFDIAVGVYDTQHFMAVSQGYDNLATGFDVMATATGDGGESWRQAWIHVDVPANGVSASIHYVDANTARLVLVITSDSADTACYEAETADGGISWTVPKKQILAAGSAVWESPTLGWSVDYANMSGALNVIPLAITLDGGETWVSSEIQGPNETPAKPIPALIQQEPGGTLRALVEWLIADSSSSSPQILMQVAQSLDGGATWSNTSSSTVQVQEVLQFAALGPGHWLASSVEPGHLYVTWDYGVTWQLMSMDLSLILQTFVFADENTGWAVGSPACGAAGQGCVASDHIFRTLDGGATWTEIYPQKVSR